MWGEVANQIGPTFGNRLTPVACVLDEAILLRRVDSIANKACDHLQCPYFAFFALEMWILHIDLHECFVYDRSMKEGPDIALLGSLIGDPARANMLTALMSGKALTASELAAEAGVTLQTTSAHLGKLKGGGLVRQRKQGRHRYFSLADDDVGGVLESMMGLAAKKGHSRTRTGPKDPALRKARVCYNHLAGELGVEMFDSLMARRFLIEDGDDLALTAKGWSFVTQFGVDVDTLKKLRRPLCKSCLDWSARRNHLAGSLGAALLVRFYQLGWAKREDGTRVVTFTKKGEARFLANFSA